MTPNRPQTLIRLDVSVGSKSDTLAVCRSLPVCTRLRTCRSPEITDALARCAGSPTASAVTGGKIVKTQNRCALVRPLRRCGLSANMVVTDRTVHIRAQDAEGCICIVKNLNDGHRAIGKAEIILTSSLKQFRLDNIEVCCGLQKYWFAL